MFEYILDNQMSSPMYYHTIYVVNYRYSTIGTIELFFKALLPLPTLRKRSIFFLKDQSDKRAKWTRTKRTYKNFENNTMMM